MATNAVEEDVEYESDPDEAKRSLTMRRREAASDDEDGEAVAAYNKREDHVHSDDSDGQGGVAEYDDDDDEEEELEEELEEEEELDEEEEVEEVVYEERGVEEEGGASGGAEGSVVKESDGDFRPPLEGSAEAHLEEKKENDPFAVPTAGAFYMHDDRFRDNAGARHRLIHGGRRLWESKDDRKWGHDKYEEITLQERHYQEGSRPSKGNYRGHAKNQGTERGGYVRGNRKGYNSNNNNRRYNSNSRNQSQVPKGVVRGRGPRRYEPANKSNGPAPAPQVHNKQYGMLRKKTSNGSSEQSSAPTSKVEPNPVPSKKQVFASNLNSASPPFYPSGSSNKEINLTQKKDVQSGSTSRNEGFPVQQKNALLCGKNVVDPIGINKLYIDESIGPSVGKPLNNVQMAPPGSPGVNASQSPHPRPAGRGLAIPVQMNYQPAPSYNQINKVSPTQLQASQRSSGPGWTSASAQATAPQFGLRSGSGSQSSSPPERSASNNSFDSGEIDAASESGKSKGTLVGKGRGGSQGDGRGSFVYGGTHVMGAAGNVGVSHGDPNFPAFLPVMQFGGQHPRGIGVPTVGMAFPGYVGQPQIGLGSSEMTWLPVLAGAAGALGATYCSPYLAVDGPYTRQPGQTSATDASSKESNANKANNELKPPERSEVLSDEFGQRQNKPRRYSEMNFGQ